jgi:predicted amidophosphoribosyltransferase
MTKTHPCADCSKDAYEPYPRCPDCMRRLKAARICKWCGKEPRSPTSKSGYCVACQRAAFERVVEIASEQLAVDADAKPRYRGPDARENTTETKYGSNR